MEEPVTHHEVNEMVRMGDKSQNGGVNEDDFMLLMRELGLWGKKHGISDEPDGVVVKEIK